MLILHRAQNEALVGRIKVRQKLHKRGKMFLPSSDSNMLRLGHFSDSRLVCLCATLAILLSMVEIFFRIIGSTLLTKSPIIPLEVIRDLQTDRDSNVLG